MGIVNDNMNEVIRKSAKVETGGYRLKTDPDLDEDFFDLRAEIKLLNLTSMRLLDTLKLTNLYLAEMLGDKFEGDI